MSMRFTYSEDEYKWCVQCNGNIRKNAYYCRYCRSPVGSKLLQTKSPQNVTTAITRAASWLLNFDDLVLQSLPLQFRERIDTADQEIPTSFGRGSAVDPVQNRKRERNSSLCPPSPPTAQTRGLIWDVLLAIHEQKAPLNKLCSDVRLKLLEISVDEVSAEYDRRLEEIHGGQNCQHCAEFISQSNGTCRFCEGKPDIPPKQRDCLVDIYPYDPDLHRRVLVWECAKRLIDQQDPLDAAILQKHQIKQAEIDSQMVILRQNPSMLPHSRWRQRMIDLGITPAYFGSVEVFDLDSYMFDDVTTIARALTPDSTAKDQADAGQALFVFDHVLNHWLTKRMFGMHKHQILVSKANLYLQMNDKESYHRIKKQSEDALLATVPEAQRPSVQESLKPKLVESRALLLTLMDTIDPDERLKLLEEHYQKSAEPQAERLAKINGVVPGLGDALKSVRASSSDRFEIAKLVLKAQSALKNSDPEAACCHYEEAINLLGTSVRGVSRRSGIYLNLAHAQVVKGDQTAAEESFRRAFVDAADVLEADFDATPLSDAHHRYACFLRDSGSLSDADEHFQQAFQFHDQSQKRRIEKGRQQHALNAPWFMKEDYAKLLRLMSRDDEAEVVEAECKTLKEEDERQGQLLRQRLTRND
jgi:tetratricopeptide (TPR) repeat protein